jgi:hypothetical protein
MSEAPIIAKTECAFFIVFYIPLILLIIYLPSSDIYQILIRYPIATSVDGIEINPRITNTFDGAEISSGATTPKHVIIKKIIVLATKTVTI